MLISDPLGGGPVESSGRAGQHALDWDTRREKSSPEARDRREGVFVSRTVSTLFKPEARPTR